MKTLIKQKLTENWNQKMLSFRCDARVTDQLTIRSEAHWPK